MHPDPLKINSKYLHCSFLNVQIIGLAFQLIGFIYQQKQRNYMPLIATLSISLKFKML